MFFRGLEGSATSTDTSRAFLCDARKLKKTSELAPGTEGRRPARPPGLAGSPPDAPGSLPECRKARAPRPKAATGLLDRPGLRSFLAGLLATPFTFKAEELLACSRVFINDRKLAKIVVRSMDLPLSIPERPKFFVFPRGMARSSDNSVIPGIRAKVEGIGSNFVRWTSRLGNVVMTGFDGAATDGLNENGLAAHVLELGESQHEPKDDRSELPDSHWAQYVLDTFATVKDVVDAHNAGKFRVVAAWLGNPVQCVVDRAGLSQTTRPSSRRRRCFGRGRFPCSHSAAITASMAAFSIRARAPGSSLKPPLVGGAEGAHRAVKSPFGMMRAAPFSTGGNAVICRSRPSSSWRLCSRSTRRCAVASAFWALIRCSSSVLPADGANRASAAISLANAFDGGTAGSGGVAVGGQRLFAGFRGPVIDNKSSVILSAALGHFFDGKAADATLHLLPLGPGRGVRDLAAFDKGLLILAGPLPDRCKTSAAPTRSIGGMAQAPAQNF